MPDNANPIIHGRADAATSKRRTAFLDDSDEEDWFSLGDVSDVVSSASGSSRGSGTAGRPNGHQGRVTGDEEPIDAEEIFGAIFVPLAATLGRAADCRRSRTDLIRSVTDPEHPLTLEQLAVVSKEQITVTHASDSTTENPHVLLEFTPTVRRLALYRTIDSLSDVRDAIDSSLLDGNFDRWARFQQSVPRRPD